MMNLETKQKIVSETGYRFATYGDQEATITHAICDCGIMVPKNEDSHICVWTRLVPVENIQFLDQPEGESYETR